MNKKYIIRKNQDIEKIVKNNKKIVGKNFIIYYENNNLNYNKFCISVSKKIGKANVRNLLKRKVKDILMKNNIDSSYDYVIILRNGVTSLTYIEMKEEIINLLKGNIK